MSRQEICLTEVSELVRYHFCTGVSMNKDQLRRRDDEGRVWTPWVKAASGDETESDVDDADSQSENSDTVNLYNYLQFGGPPV